MQFWMIGSNLMGSFRAWSWFCQMLCWRSHSDFLVFFISPQDLFISPMNGCLRPIQRFLKLMSTLAIMMFRHRRMWILHWLSLLVLLGIRSSIRVSLSIETHTTEWKNLVDGFSSGSSSFLRMDGAVDAPLLREIDNNFIRAFAPQLDLLSESKFNTLEFLVGRFVHGHGWWIWGHCSFSWSRSCFFALSRRWVR